MKLEIIKKNKNNAIIAVDGEIINKFSLEILFKEHIFSECEIEENEWKRINEENDRQKAKEYVFNLLSRQLKTEKEIKTKLYEKGFFGNAVKYAIEKGKEYNLIDDKNYAKCYINTYINSKGSMKIKYELKNKGINSEIIDEFLVDTEEKELETAMKICQKYINIKGEKATGDKIYKHLYQKGYRYEIIKEVLGKMKDD